MTFTLASMPYTDTMKQLILGKTFKHGDSNQPLAQCITHSCSI